MADVLERANLFNLRLSVNTPEFPVGLWVINPNLVPVVGVPVKYWVLTGDILSEMTQPQKDVVDAAELQAAQILQLEALDEITRDVETVASISDISNEDLIDANMTIASLIGAATTPAGVNQVDVTGAGIAGSTVQVGRNESSSIGVSSSLSPFGRDFVFDEDATIDTTSSDTFATKVTLAVGNPDLPAGTFLIRAKAFVSCSNTNAVALLSVFNLTGAVEMCTRNPAYQQSDTDNVTAASIDKTIELDGTEQKTIELRYARATGGGGGTISISDAMLMAWRIG